MNVIARLPDCAGQAVDAVSAYIQVKIEDLQNCSKFRSQDVQTQNGPNHGQTLKICGSTSSTKFLRSSASRIVMGKTVRGSPNGTWMGESTEFGMSVCSSEARVDDMKIAGRKQHMAPM